MSASNSGDDSGDVLENDTNHEDITKIHGRPPLSEKPNTSPDKKSDKSPTKPSINNKSQETPNSSEKKKFNCSICLAIIFVVIALVSCIDYKSTYNCSYNFEAIKNNFTSQTSEVMQSVEVSLEVNDKIKVKTLVLLHDESGANTANCLANQIAKSFSCGNFQNTSFTTFTANELNEAESFGKFLRISKNRMYNAVVVKDLNEVKSENAQMFHTMCDEITPYISPSLYIFTMATRNINSGIKPFKEAREILANKWSNLDDNILDPLINRILGFVSYVKHEQILPC